MKLDIDPRLPNSGPDLLTRLSTRLYEFLRQVATAVNERELIYTEVELTDAATVTIDGAIKRCFRLTLGGNRTLATPINLVAGNVINLALKQDATGSRTVTWGSDWDWGVAGTPTLSTVAGRVDFVSAYYSGAHSKLIAIFWKDA